MPLRHVLAIYRSGDPCSPMQSRCGGLGIVERTSPKLGVYAQACRARLTRDTPSTLASIILYFRTHCLWIDRGGNKNINKRNNPTTDTTAPTSLAPSSVFNAPRSKNKRSQARNWGAPAVPLSPKARNARNEVVTLTPSATYHRRSKILPNRPYSGAK